LALSLSRTVIALSQAGLARRLQGSDPDTVGLRFVGLHYGADLADEVRGLLEWYRWGGEVSARQWSDVLGILRVGGEAVDRVYLSSGALELGVLDLLDRAIQQAEPD